ncbi:glycosyl hydrolase family 18 protein [Streptomyces sp. NPDC056500]|uniref:glycosyl hydrolase family 18 protein n=1 Tax=Streptomyces sp. NPDC056500 TaxID=3345840 RepID=UPI0036CC60B7
MRFGILATRMREGCFTAALWLVLPVALIGLTTPAQAVTNADSSTSGRAVDDIYPTAPGDVKVTAVTDTAVTLSWTPSIYPRDIPYYNVEVISRHVGTTTYQSASTTFTTPHPLDTATDYEFAVSAMGVDWRSSPRVIVKARTNGAATPPPANPVKMGVFHAKSGYIRDYQVKDVVTSGTAAKITHLTYAYGKVTGGKCAVGDTYNALEKTFQAERSVDGRADTWDQPLRGQINQLRKLTSQYPSLKIIWAFGGPENSGGFRQAMQDPAAFATSCAQLVNDPRWAGVFDGIDLDWDLPWQCQYTNTCDNGGPSTVKDMTQAFRTAFGNQIVTTTFNADHGVINYDYPGAAPYVDWFNVESYDYLRPTDPGTQNLVPPAHVYSYEHESPWTVHHTFGQLRARGIHPNKLVLGIPSHALGWEGVVPNGSSWRASRPAWGNYGMGLEDYRNIKTRCPGPRLLGGSAYSTCGSLWWGYDIPDTVVGKMAYAKQYSLGGAFLSNLRGDTDEGELIDAIDRGLR